MLCGSNVGWNPTSSSELAFRWRGDETWGGAKIASYEGIFWEHQPSRRTSPNGCVCWMCRVTNSTHRRLPRSCIEIWRVWNCRYLQWRGRCLSDCHPETVDREKSTFVHYAHALESIL